MAATADVPHLDHEISVENLKESVEKVVRLLRPDWKIDDYKIECKSTGYVNQNYAIVRTNSDEDGLFLRLVNKDITNLLQMTMNVMTYLKRHRLGAQLLMTFNNGLVLELVQGEPITWPTYYLIKEKSVWLGAAREMALWHGTTSIKDIEELKIPNHVEMSNIFNQQFLGVVERNNMAVDGIPDLRQIPALRNKIYDVLIQDGAEMGFCHMDSNPTNFVITKKGPVLIDYDFCNLDLFCVSIASLFCTTVNMDDPDLNDLPTESEKEEFIREYLKARAELQPERGPVTERLVEHWKFFMRKASLVFLLNGIQGILLASAIGNKKDSKSVKQYWDLYKSSESFLNEKFV